MNISLRDLRTSDAAWVDAWLPQVASPFGYDESNASALLLRVKKGPDFRARVIVREGVDVGVAAYRTLPPAAGVIELITTPREHARKGAGMAAAALIEDELKSAGVRIIYTPAPAANGIAMYFWIRLGYAPILRNEWLCDREGVAWLRRSIVGD